ncbi:MAG: polyprenyl synthetase family protein [Omnitrophica bacterium]|nr:polyprenyl synthetase family protein [Candidatus Omnitrophota bacterium]
MSTFLKSVDKIYSLGKSSPLLFNNLKKFTLNPGKRIRPILFVAGYLGFTKKAAAGLYRSAVSIELLHDFFLVHDDIIDKSDIRRGKPSMHKSFDNHLKKFRNVKFKGQDLAIVAGDIIYILSLECFLAIDESPGRKEKALKKFLQAGLYTAKGEFMELVLSLKKIQNITKDEIYQVYDQKTAYYSFAAPLAIGAILAGADKNQVNRVFKYGMFLGRAFQIKDDILGIFGTEATTGKSCLSDLQESKKTLLLWYAFNMGSKKQKNIIVKILAKRKVDKKDLSRIGMVIKESGSLRCAENEIKKLLMKSESILTGSLMNQNYKKLLTDYVQAKLTCK